MYGYSNLGARSNSQPPTGYSSQGARLDPHPATVQISLVSVQGVRVDMWHSLYLAGRLQVIPCGTTAGPLRHDSRVCVRGLTRTRHKVILRRCMCAIPNTHVPMGYTSLVSVYVDAVCSYGVQVIPCGVGYVLYLAGSPVRPLTKACHNGGCRMLLLMISIAISACSVNTWFSILTSPWSRSTGTP